MAHQEHHAEAASPRMVIFALAVFFAMSLAGHFFFVMNAGHDAGKETSHAQPSEHH